MKILIDIPEIENFVKILDKERQTHVNAANTILVVAALIGSVTFASGLQPPLGYSPINLHMEAPSPDGMYPSFASVEGHPNMPFFYICNSLSFVFAIVALVMASAAALPARTDRSIGLMIPYMRRALVSAYIFLCFSLLCFVSTFVMAYFIVAGICYNFFHHMKNYRYFYCLVFVIYGGWIVFCFL